MSRIALGGSPCAGVSIGSCCALSGGCMKRTPGFTDEEREQYWIKIINQARRDPRGVTAFLLEQGVEKNNYYQWFKTLRRSHPEWHDLSKDPNHRALKERSKSGAKLPKTEVVEKAKRRRWSPKEKGRILDELESAGSGKGNAILRREGIYSSQIQQWRLEREQGSLVAKKRGPKPNPAAHEVKQLKAQLARTEKKLAQANALLDLQKKVAEILRTLEPTADDD
jgi:transposase